MGIGIYIKIEISVVYNNIIPYHIHIYIYFHFLRSPDMGNCQAVDNASFVLQTQNGRAERFYSPISAAEIMKLHPGHHVALLLTTTFYSSPPPSTTTTTSSHHHHHHLHRRQHAENNNNSPTKNTNQPLRVTRIKLLRPTDNLVLGHAYRLITTQGLFIFIMFMSVK